MRTNRPVDVPHPGWLLVLLVIVLAVACSGCSQFGYNRTQNENGRYLTEEQDREMRELCESEGCMVVGGRAWEQIQRALKACGFRGI